MAALSKEEDRFTRVNMLIGVATQALRIKFDQWQPPGALPVTLHKIKTKIIPSITRIQENILYPKLGTVSSCDMDITLMVCVLRNTGFPAPHSTFDRKPHERDISEGADVARIKFYRNQLAHQIGKRLNDKDFGEISQALIEVIRRFCGPLYNDKIRSIMQESLDYLKGTFSYHVHSGIAFAQNAFNETVINPTKETVVQLYEHQPLHYSIYGGTVVVYFIKNIFKEEPIYNTREELHEYSYGSQRITKVCLYQRQQSVEIEGNVTFPVLILDSISALYSNSPGLKNLQYRYGKRTSLLWSRPCVTDSLYANDTMFETQLYVNTTNFCNDLAIENYRSLQQLNIPSCSKYAANCCDVSCRMEQEPDIILSSNSTDSKRLQQQFICCQSSNVIQSMSDVLERKPQCDSDYIDTNFRYLSQSDSNKYGCVLIERIAVIKRENKEQSRNLYVFLLFISLLAIGITVFIQSSRNKSKLKFKDFRYKILKTKDYCYKLFERPENKKKPDLPVYPRKKRLKCKDTKCR